MQTQYPIITISRQYGSGGRDIGSALARELRIPFYDHELIAIAAKGSGIAETVFAQAEDRARSRLKLKLERLAGGGEYNMSLNDQVFQIQSGVIRTIADRGPAVIVGRCADFVLKDYAPTVNVFIQAPLEYRLQQTMARKNYAPSQAQEFLKRVDKSRAAYHNFYADTRWGRSENYDLCLNSGRVSEAVCVRILVDYVRDALGDLLPRQENV